VCVCGVSVCVYVCVCVYTGPSGRAVYGVGLRPLAC